MEGAANITGKTIKWVQRISSIDDRWKIDSGRVKNSVGNVEAKELISMTHGHELWGGNVGGRGVGRMEWSGGGNGTTVIA